MSTTLNRNEIMRLIHAHDNFLASHGVSRLGLFGSFAREEERADSDVDLIVEFKTGEKTYDNFIDICYFLEELLGRRVDLLTPESISPAIRPFIEREVRYEIIH